MSDYFEVPTTDEQDVQGVLTVELNTNLVKRIFNGTYENIWGEYEEEDDNGKNRYMEYNFDSLMKSIQQAYVNNAKTVKDELNVSFITDIRFGKGWWSPSYYNFSTDRLEFEADIDTEKLNKTLEDLANDSSFEEWLHSHYSSRDGFWSFTPNNYKELRTEIEEQGEHFEQALGALITYLSRHLDNRDFYNSIEGMVYEDWSGNGFYGLDYTLVPYED